MSEGEWTGEVVLNHVHELEGWTFSGELDAITPQCKALVAFLRGIPNVASRQTGGVHTFAIHAVAVQGEARIAGLARLSLEPVLHQLRLLKPGVAEELAALGLYGRVPLEFCVEPAELTVVSTVVAAALRIIIDAPGVGAWNIGAWAGKYFTVTCRSDERFYALRDALRDLTAAEAITWYEALPPGDREIAADIARQAPSPRFAHYPPNGVDELAAYLASPMEGKGA